MLCTPAPCSESRVDSVIRRAFPTRPPVSKYEPQVYRDYVSGLFNSFAGAAKRLDLTVPTGLVVGGLPMPCFNAAGSAQPPLVLINMGFEMQQGEFAKVAALAMPTIFEDTDHVEFSDDATADGDSDEDEDES